VAMNTPMSRILVRDEHADEWHILHAQGAERLEGCRIKKRQLPLLRVIDV